MATCSRRAAWLPHVAKTRLQRVRSPACECPQNMPSAWLGPQTNQCRQTRPFTGPWESCDSIRQEHALVCRGDSLSARDHIGRGAVEPVHQRLHVGAADEAELEVHLCGLRYELRIAHGG